MTNTLLVIFPSFPFFPVEKIIGGQGEYAPLLIHIFRLDRGASDRTVSTRVGGVGAFVILGHSDGDAIEIDG